MLPILIVTMIALPVPIFLNYLIIGFWENLIVVGLATLIVTVLDVYYVGMNVNERAMVQNVIIKKIPILKKK